MIQESLDRTVCTKITKSIKDRLLLISERDSMTVSDTVRKIIEDFLTRDRGERLNPGEFICPHCRSTLLPGMLLTHMDKRYTIIVCSLCHAIISAQAEPY